MEERRAKRTRLQSLRDRLPFISQSALAAVLKFAAAEPVHEGVTRDELRNARNQIVAEQTPYGPLHQLIMMGETSVEFQHPAAMLYHVCKTSTSFSDLLDRVHTATPCAVNRPWRLVLYMDEITPGNQLAHKHARKMWASYWSILEFGSAILCDEARPAPETMHRIICGRLASKIVDMVVVVVVIIVVYRQVVVL